MLKLFRSKIILALFLMLTMLSIGVLGYRYVSDYTWLNMTIITVTTVGFKEVEPLDTEANVFTIFLIISSVFVFANNYRIRFKQKFLTIFKNEKSEIRHR